MKMTNEVWYIGEDFLNCTQNGLGHVMNQSKRITVEFFDFAKERDDFCGLFTG